MNTAILRSRILDLAIHGQLVPQDPSEGSAAELLQDIAKQRVGQKLSKVEKQVQNNATSFFEIPQNWEWVRLFDVSRVFGRIGFRGYTTADLRESKEEGAISLSPSNIKNDLMVYTTCTYISKEKYDESPEIQVNNGDILVVKTGSSYGKVAYVENLPWLSTINPQLAVIKEISIFPKYLTLALQSAVAKQQYKSFVIGTATPTFSQLNLLSMSIPLPPLKEQQRIVSRVEELLKQVDIIEQAQLDIRQTATILRSKIIEDAINGRFSETTEDWGADILANVLNYEQPGAYIVSSTEYSDSYPTPVLTAGKSFILGYTNETHGIYSKGSCIIFDDFTTDSKYVDFPFKVKSSAMKILQPARNDVDLKYVYYFMSITRLIGDTHKRFWISEYSQIELPLPPLSEQQRIVAQIEELFKQIDLLI